jgi:O-acetyl-ADP-ribose deacetylase (regulator of RNase III)
MQFIKGNLLEATTEALVNTVNTVGVMGKGIALQFKERFPQNFKSYREACKAGTLDIGKLLPVKENTLAGEQWIINFPTKRDWKEKSKLAYIEAGLQELVRVIALFEMKSIALPPLGCGLGGLDWADVRPLIVQYLGNLENVEVVVYEPNEAIKALLQKENTPKEVKLTPARAILLYAMFHYEALGEEVNLFVANKLAYFLQRLGEKLKLDFIPYHYGPYSDRVRHVLYSLNGVYLKGLEQNSATAFESLQLNYEKFGEVKAYIDTHLSQEQQQRLDNLLLLISGFESAFSLEALATVDYVSQNQTLTIEGIKEKLSDWSYRKQNLFKDYHIQVIHAHLNHYKQLLNFA